MVLMVVVVVVVVVMVVVVVVVVMYAVMRYAPVSGTLMVRAPALITSPNTSARKAGSLRPCDSNRKHGKSASCTKENVRRVVWLACAACVACVARVACAVCVCGETADRVLR
jgi:hypothetical protein